MSNHDSVGELLRELAGGWEGQGAGNFPTIDPFRYRESLVFTPHPTTGDLHYEQRTWLVSAGEDDGDPSHWESGFLLVQEDASMHLLNAQQSGRVEVLTGGLHARGPLGFELRFESVVHAHDPRLRWTSRVYRFDGDQLHYECRMATDRVSAHEVHLECRLVRAGT